MKLKLFFVSLAAALSLALTAQAGSFQFKNASTDITRVQGEFTNTVKDGKLVATIDLSKQEMCIERTGRRTTCFTISSGAKGYETPVGTYKPQRIYERYFSKTYDDAPMHWAVFFHGGYAVHQTGSYLGMGTAASHGCIRATPVRARQFYKWVQAYGPNNTTIKVVN